MNNPECCDTEMEEVFRLYQDFSDEYGEAHEGLAGYRCKVCGTRYSLNGEEITNGS